MSRYNFKLKNFTTGVNADKTIMEIEKLLSQFGATHIMKEYLGDGRVFKLSFRYEEAAYQIPLNFEGVKNIMYGERATTSTQAQEEQAYRTSWRILKDWIHSQLSIIASGQAVPEQVLLPYRFDGKRTLYEAFKEGRLQIEGGEQDES